MKITNLLISLLTLMTIGNSVTAQNEAAIKERFGCSDLYQNNSEVNFGVGGNWYTIYTTATPDESHCNTHNFVFAESSEVVIKSIKIEGDNDYTPQVYQIVSHSEHDVFVANSCGEENELFALSNLEKPTQAGQDWALDRMNELNGTKTISICKF